MVKKRVKPESRETNPIRASKAQQIKAARKLASKRNKRVQPSQAKHGKLKLSQANVQETSWQTQTNQPKQI